MQQRNKDSRLRPENELQLDALWNRELCEMWQENEILYEKVFVLLPTRFRCRAPFSLHSGFSLCPKQPRVHLAGDTRLIPRSPGNAKTLTSLKIVLTRRRSDGYLADP